MPTPESLPSLTSNQINVLVVLMAEARELTNNELKELSGLALTGADNTKLSKLGLVETDKSHRPFSHQLTDAGWQVTREIHRGAPPVGSRSATRSLFTLLKNLERALDHSHVSYGDFFKQQAAIAQTGAPVEARIRTAYGELAKAPGDWVGLADLRDRLADIDQPGVDAALRALATQDGVRIIPVANTKSLQPRDRAAAVRIGDEDNHALSIGAA